MAYFLNDEEQQLAPSGSPVTLSAPNSPPPAGPTPGSPAPSPGGSPGTGTGFVNFSRILGLNEGSAKGMADKLNAPGSQGISGANTQLGTIENEVQNILRGPAEVAKNFDINQNPAFGAVGTEIGKLSGTLGLLSDPAGRGSLLRDTLAKGHPYSAGQARFDSALAGAGGAGRGMTEALQGLQKRWGGLRDSTQAAVGKLNAMPPQAAPPQEQAPTEPTKAPYRPPAGRNNPGRPPASRIPGRSPPLTPEEIERRERWKKAGF